MARLKKSLGQHLLTDSLVVTEIVNRILLLKCDRIIEIGPGRGALTRQLVERLQVPYLGIEYDDHFYAQLCSEYLSQEAEFVNEDALQFDFGQFKGEAIAVVGNFPYNISTQIIFRILEHGELIADVVGMFQKEVAMRVSGKFIGKNFGVQSVLVNTYFDTEYLFTVPPTAFKPPPKVDSGVISLSRKAMVPDFAYNDLKKLVKAVFSLRRKKIRNSLQKAGYIKIDNPWADLRPEQLEIGDFHALLKHLHTD